MVKKGASRKRKSSTKIKYVKTPKGYSPAPAFKPFSKVRKGHVGVYYTKKRKSL